jgi:hypothetical protein
VLTLIYTSSPTTSSCYMCNVMTQINVYSNYHFACAKDVTSLDGCQVSSFVFFPPLLSRPPVHTSAMRTLLHLPSIFSDTPPHPLLACGSDDVAPTVGPCYHPPPNPPLLPNLVYVRRRQISQQPRCHTRV